LPFVRSMELRSSLTSQFNENAVTLVWCPYPHDVEPHTYVHGIERGVLMTAENAAHPLPGWACSRLWPNLRARFDAGLGQRVCRHWYPSAASDGQQMGGTVRAVIIVGALHQVVCEDVQMAANLLNVSAS
jgi:hypothetical protein